jgi:ABC-type transport system involved in multi-copper enzyme maturation permease subunit
VGRILSILSILSPAAWLGPIFQKEVRTAGRRKSTYVLRGLYASGLVAIVAIAFYAIRAELGVGSVVLQLQSMQRVAPEMSVVIGWFQFGALFFAAPVLAAGSICDERRARSLDVLMTTPMTAGHIVVGKLTSRIVQLVILALLAAPVLLAVRVFGGLDAEVVLASTCVAISTAVLGAALAILFSVRQKRATMAALFAILSLILLQCGPSLVEGIRYELMNQHGAETFPFKYNILATCSGGVMNDLAGAVGQGQPLGHLVFGVAAKPVGPGVAVGKPLLDAGPMWLANTGYNLLLAAGVTLYTTLVLRRAMKTTHQREKLLQGTSGDNATQQEGYQPAPEPEASPAPPTQNSSKSKERFRSREREVADNPVLWREVRQPTFGSRRVFRIAAVIVVVGLGLLYWRVGVADVGLHLTLAIIGALAIMFQAVFLTSGPYAGEREARTWDVLLTTDLSAGQILVGKLLGTLRGFWFIPAIVMLDFVIGVIAGYIRPAALLYLPLTYLGPILFFTSTGQMLSLRFRRAVTAGALNLGVAIAVWALVWLLILLLPAILGGVLALPKMLRLMKPDVFIDNLMDNHLETLLNGAFAINPIAMVVRAVDPCLLEAGPRGVVKPPFETRLLTHALDMKACTQVVLAVFGSYCLAAAGMLGITRLRFRKWSGRTS